MLKPVLSRNFVPSKIERKFAFWAKMGSKCKNLVFETRESTTLRETTSFDVLIVKIGTAA